MLEIFGKKNVAERIWFYLALLPYLLLILFGIIAGSILSPLSNPMTTIMVAPVAAGFFAMLFTPTLIMLAIYAFWIVRYRNSPIDKRLFFFFGVLDLNLPVCIFSAFFVSPYTVPWYAVLPGTISSLGLISCCRLWKKGMMVFISQIIQFAILEGLLILGLST